MCKKYKRTTICIKYIKDVCKHFTKHVGKNKMVIKEYYLSISDNDYIMILYRLVFMVLGIIYNIIIII